MSAVVATQTAAQDAGNWRITARRPGYQPVDVTYVRGVPTQIGEWKEQSPFGWSSVSLTFGGVTMYDRIGQGDLFWLAPEVNFDIEWVGSLPDGYPYDRFVIEAFSMPFNHSSTSETIELIGAAFQLDHFQAKPEYANQPFPYEVAMRRQWADKPSLRLRRLLVEWPSWWTETYTPDPTALPQFIPTGVRKGDKWTGLLTRETGSWEPVLSSYIQTMLTSMYTSRGRWTMSLRPGRQPVLHHLDMAVEPAKGTIVIHPLQPGVKISLKEPWDQSANVYYGQVKSLAGEAYSGMQVVGDGQATVYKPLAALRQVDPVDDRNTWLQQHRMRKESLLQVQDGLTALEAASVGQSHLTHFADPGQMGTVTLTSDVHILDSALAEQPLHRALIRAGMTLHLPGFKGVPEGILLLVVDTAFNPSTGTMTLTVDTKWRDKLTMDEVKVRGRDALSVPRMLIAGKYAPLLPDMLFPWNYAEGSGYIPSSPTFSARRLFEGMPGDISFPWTEWTTQRPPKSASWKSCYIPVGAKANSANDNWAFAANRGGGKFGIPIRMAQAGSIRLLQLAAFDKDGNVMEVPFHFSLYYQRDVNVMAMPRIPAGKVPAGSTYAVGEHYPFFEQAFETYNLDGTQVGTEVPVTVQSAGLIRGWGTGVQKAGHWPGSSSANDPATGLLVDEEPFSFDLVGPTPHINQYAKGDVSPYAGYLYCMIYCDAQAAEEVFFLGRMYRAEPGASV